MVNLQRRHQTEPIGIHYFVAPPPKGEVRFPRPPVTKPVTKKHALPREKPVTKPVTEDKSYAHYEAQEVKKRLTAYQCLAIIFLTTFFTVCWAGPQTICFLLAKFGPQPSALILPPPPYHEGQKIQGPDTTGQTHLWIYVEKAGWVDP